MSVFSWSRRPSAPDTSGTIPPRARTTSGGGLAALAGSMLSLSKAKSRERLRAKASPNRQTVVSTESESSVWPNEPTTPSSASDTNAGFQVGDDPFARPPVYVSKEPSLAAFPDPPVRHPQRNHSSPLLHPPSPKSSRTSSRSTSVSSSKSPPPLVTSVSTADMHAHADAFSWTESIYDDRPAEPSIRRGQSANAVLNLSSASSPSGIVQRLQDGETRRKPPKRPSRSELRDPPTRKSSLLALQAESRTLEPTPESRPTLEPRSSDSIIKPLDHPVNPISPPRSRTASGGLRPAPTSPRSAPRFLPSSPRLLPTSPSPRLLPSSPRLLPSSPRLAIPPGRFSEDSEDLDNYRFAPTIQEADAHSISFSELGIQLADDEDVWSDDGVTFHHGPTDSLHHVSADSSRYASTSRRPPPSPTSLPFMAGNVRRRPKHDMVYPSGVHTIPIADQRALAKLGKDEVGKEEDAVVGIAEEPDRSSKSSLGSSLAPDAVPPQTISSHIAFSKHARTASYSDSELDVEVSCRINTRLVPSIQTAVAWRCGAGNHEKCCGTRAIEQGPNAGQYKCCADRTPNGKHARCCASYVGRPCERPRVSSTSSVELKRQRSLHFASAKGFFHRPHTSHGKSTSSALLDDETRAMIQSQQQAKAREDPGPQSPSLINASPPTSPASRPEFKAKPIISPAKLQDHLKEMRLSSPEPLRARSNTDTSESVSGRSVFSNLSEDAPAPMRSLLPPRPRRTQNVSLPTMKSGQPLAEQPRRYVHSIAGVVQSAGFTRPMPPPSLSSSSSSSITSSGPSLSSITSSPGFSPFPPRVGLLPPPRRDHLGRINAQPIVSFISSRSAPSLTGPESTLRHCSSRESYESSRTVRRERSIPLREAQMSFLEFEVEEEEEEEEEEEDEMDRLAFRPTLHSSQSFLDLDPSRMSGDTMRETDAMFSRS